MLQFRLLNRFPHLFHGVITEENDLNLPAHTLEVHQVHGNTIVQVTNKLEDLPPADGLITNEVDTFLLIKTADCAPVFLFDPQKNCVGIIHVGWQGASTGIHKKAIKMLENKFQTRPQDIIIGIGPAICSNCYTFATPPQQMHEKTWQNFISSQNNLWYVDLPGFIRSELVTSGIMPDHIENMNMCTYEKHSLASHRRARATNEPAGRILSVIGLKAIQN